MSKPKKAIRYTENPELGELVLIDDFLPSPEELVFRRDDVDVTLSLSPESVAYFQERAQQSNTRYQLFIRSLLERYVRQQRESADSGR